MGVDEALLASAVAGAPTLRLYRWRGPWLSIGYAQRITPERVAACAAAGVGLVRRVSGGGAVLHGADLTYALAAPEALLPPGLEGSYALVTDALLAALAALGVPAERAGARPVEPEDPVSPVDREDPVRRADRPFDCFVGAAREEIRAGGRKLVGSAQRRAGGAVLQHGSIRLAPDPPAAALGAGLVPGASTSLRELGWSGSPEAVADAIAHAFRARLGIPLVPGAPTAGERAAGEARRQRHAADPLGAPARNGAHLFASRPFQGGR